MRHYPDHDGLLDPEADALLTRLARTAPAPLSALTPEKARAEFLPAEWRGANADVQAIRTLAIDGPGGALPARVYVPRGRAPFPVLAFFHGGGFVAGELAEFDAFCTAVAAGAACLVVSGGYRLAPEHRAPAAVEDAVAVMAWIGAHAAELGGDARRLAIAGDSAGANLAAVCAIASRDRGAPRLALQVLLSPWVDLSPTAYESYRLFGGGRWLSKASLDWYRDHYLADAAQALSPRISPLLAPDLARLPPALVVSAEFDPLRDQARAFAQRLEAAGTAVDHRLYPGTLHDFAALPGVFTRAGEAIGDVCAALRRALA
jgi:acetyl esterase